MTVETCKYIESTELIPDNWDWFFCAISENAPFSWGDNNRTMVSPERFLNHCEDVFEFHEEVDEDEKDIFVKRLKTLIRLDDASRADGGMGIYIDLEH